MEHAPPQAARRGKFPADSAPGLAQGEVAVLLLAAVVPQPVEVLLRPPLIGALREQRRMRQCDLPLHIQFLVVLERDQAQRLQGMVFAGAHGVPAAAAQSRAFAGPAEAVLEAMAPQIFRELAVSLPDLVPLEGDQPLLHASGQGAMR